MSSEVLQAEVPGLALAPSLVDFIRTSYGTWLLRPQSTVRVVDFIVWLEVRVLVGRGSPYSPAGSR